MCWRDQAAERSVHMGTPQPSNPYRSGNPGTPAAGVRHLIDVLGQRHEEVHHPVDQQGRPHG